VAMLVIRSMKSPVRILVEPDTPGEMFRRSRLCKGLRAITVAHIFGSAWRNCRATGTRRHQDKIAVKAIY
jgi:hypothetical protein